MTKPTALRIVVWIALVLVAAPVFAQETQFEADLRREREHVRDACSDFNAKAVAGCLYTVATQSPFHVALGSLAPQNGFGFGLAFNEHYTPNESWRLSWNADAVSAFSGSWRAGAYMKIVHTPATSGVVVRQPGTSAPAADIGPRQFPAIDLFVQSISLKTLYYFGPGQQSVESGRSTFGESETVVGTSAIYPIGGVHALAALRPALLGGVSGRFVDIRPGPANEAASIGELYNTVAPGLAQQRPFLELREGIRLKPSVANGRLNFNYLFAAQQFRASRDVRSSFNRWTMDLQHQIPLYRRVSSGAPADTTGPNECAPSGGSCPAVQWSRNRQGAIGLRLLLNAFVHCRRKPRARSSSSQRSGAATSTVSACLPATRTTASVRRTGYCFRSRSSTASGVHSASTFSPNRGRSRHAPAISMPRTSPPAPPWA